MSCAGRLESARTLLFGLERAGERREHPDHAGVWSRSIGSAHGSVRAGPRQAPPSALPNAPLRCVRALRPGATAAETRREPRDQAGRSHRLLRPAAAQRHARCSLRRRTQPRPGAPRPPPARTCRGDCIGTRALFCVGLVVAALSPIQDPARRLIESRRDSVFSRSRTPLPSPRVRRMRPANATA